MNDALLSIVSSDDRNTVLLQIIGASGKSDIVHLAATGVEELIRQLAYRRQAMFEAPSAEPPKDGGLLSAADPLVRVHHDQENELLRVDVRHLGLGWLRLQFHRPVATAFSATLALALAGRFDS